MEQTTDKNKTGEIKAGKTLPSMFDREGNEISFKKRQKN